MPDIFLSYNREDQVVAKRFAKALEAAELSVWWDTALHSGEAYDEVTENALHSAKAVVVLWSPRSVSSRWVRAEATVADQNKTLVPVTIEACRRPVMFELTQTADLSHWRGQVGDQVWQAFLDDVRRMVGRGSVSAMPAPAPASGFAPAKAVARGWMPRFGWAVAGLCALLLIVGAGFVVTRPVRHVSATTVASLASGPSIAVLPFANLTGDPSKDYLGEGMAEELINTLTKVPGLKVPARTSTFAYRGRNTDIRRIASDLGVGSVLEGSVRTAGNHIRVTAQLINARDGLHIWSETYDEQFTDLFKLQDRLASEIATALQPNLNPAVETAVAQGPPTRDVEAYNLYLQGQSLLARPTVQNTQRALGYFKQALARDSKFARAYSGVASGEIGLSAVSASADEHLAAAERAARHALTLDPKLAQPHIILASIYGERGRTLDMEAERRAAVTLAPGDGLIRSVSSTMLVGPGHVREGLVEAQKAYELAPANPQVVAHLTYPHIVLGHNREARQYADAAVDLGFPREIWPVSTTYELLALRAKRYAEAADIATRALDPHDPDQARTAEVIRLVYAALGDPSRRDAALASRSRLYPASAWPSRPAPVNIALCDRSSTYYALLGAVDVATGLARQCHATIKPEDAFLRGGFGFGFWSPEVRPLRRYPGYMALNGATSDVREYYRRYGPPDDCDLNGGTLVCR
jgi:TolB-like protein